MKLSSYLKHKAVFIFGQIIISVFVALILEMLHAPIELIGLVLFFIMLLTGCTLMYEYINKRRYYARVYKTLRELDKKTLIAEMMQQPDFPDGEILYDILREATKSMNDEIALFSNHQREYREYIETWIHEIKTPIATIDLICINQKDETSAKIKDELVKVEGFVEQALYYACCNTLEKEYRISECNLEQHVKDAMKKRARGLIAAKCQLLLENLDFKVYTDTKWLDFILGQLISNSIKYRKDPFMLSITAQENKENVVLFIRDNGMGIPKVDITRVFDKGFTGSNGRKFGKSTGIGLYLCKTLCEKMHLHLEVNSESGNGTEIKIIFPKDKSILFE